MANFVIEADILNDIIWHNFKISIRKTVEKCLKMQKWTTRWKLFRPSVKKHGQFKYNLNKLCIKVIIGDLYYLAIKGKFTNYVLLGEGGFTHLGHYV